MEILIPLVVALAVMAFTVLRGRTLFVLAIQDDGRVQRRKGKPPPRCVGACQDVVRLNRLRSGEIKGVRRSGRVTLRFSRDIPQSARQAIRNVCTPSPPTRGGGGRAAG